MHKAHAVDMLQRNHQLSEKIEDLCTGELRCVQELSECLSLSILHKDHNVEAYKGLACLDKIVDRTLAITVGAVVILITVAVLVVRIRVRAATVFANLLMECRLKNPALKFSAQLLLRVILVALLNRARRLFCFIKLHVDLLSQIEVGISSFNPTTFVAYNVFVG